MVSTKSISIVRFLRFKNRKLKGSNRTCHIILKKKWNHFLRLSLSLLLHFITSNLYDLVKEDHELSRNVTPIRIANISSWTIWSKKAGFGAVYYAFLNELRSPCSGVTKEYAKALNKLHQHCEILYIDDGIKTQFGTLVSQFPNLYIKSLLTPKRNFGKEAAMERGMKSRIRSCVILLDAITVTRVIPEMVKAWRNGAQRWKCKPVSVMGEAGKGTTATLFFIDLCRQWATIRFRECGDFRLMDSKSVNVIQHTAEERVYERLVSVGGV